MIHMQALTRLLMLFRPRMGAGEVRDTKFQEYAQAVGVPRSLLFLYVAKKMRHKSSCNTIVTLKSSPSGKKCGKSSVYYEF